MRLTIPWWFKIGAKILLSRIPFGYRFFATLGVFRHGKMHDAGYAIDVFTRHFVRMPAAIRESRFVCLEVGPGDSVASALVARAHGAVQTNLVDVGRFAVEDITAYQSVIKELRHRGLDIDDLAEEASLEDLLRSFNGIYLTDGLRSLQGVAAESVDFVWSQAVLEHVRIQEFDKFLGELYRVTKPQGRHSHRIDLRDHLGGQLNNRRIPSRFWEADWMARSGFYTNRISYRQMLARFENAGFNVEVVHIDRWDEMPTPKLRMAEEFQCLEEEDLLVSGFDVVLQRGISAE